MHTHTQQWRSHELTRTTGWLRCLIVAVAVFPVTATIAHAGTTWDGGGANTNIDTAGNWNDDAVPPFSGGTSSLFFSTGGTSATLNTSLDIARILLNATPTFSIGASGGSTLTLQGENLSGVNTGITAAMPWLVGSGSYTLSAPLILGADQSWNVSNGSGPTTLVVSGSISGSGRGLTKIGNGTLALAGASTYSGTTTVSGGTLELRAGASLAGGVSVAAGTTLGLANAFTSSLNVGSIVSGSGNVAVTGGGAVRLANAGNTFSGATSVTAGTLVISDPAALGNGTTPIVVSGPADDNTFSGQNRSQLGGQLLVASGSGVALGRDLALAGAGVRGISGRNVSAVNYPGGNWHGGYALQSIGNNTISGAVTTATTTTIVSSQFGLLTLAGAVTGSGGGTANLYLAGGGNIAMTGAVGPAAIQLRSGNTLILTNTANTIGSIASGGGGRLRVGSGNVLANTLFFSPGTVLEMRVAAGEVASFGTSGMTVRDGGASGIGYFADNAEGAEINQSIPLKHRDIGFGGNNYLNVGLTGRNGYGLTLSGTGGLGRILYGNLLVVANNSNGTLVIDDDLVSSSTRGADGINLRSTGDVTLDGSLSIFSPTQGTGNTLNRDSGSGQFFITGSQALASRHTGNNVLSAGTLKIRSISALATGTITIGGGSLDYAGIAGAGGNETVSQPLNLANTAYLYANQPSTAARLLVQTPSGTITASGANVKTFSIGGSSDKDNEIASAIIDNSVTNITNLQKRGAGTWLLSGSNTFTGTTTISGGELKLQAATGRNVLPDVRPLVFGVDTFTNSAAGTLWLLGENNAASTETTGTLTPTAGAARIIASGSGTGSAVLTLAALGARTAGATIEFNPGTSGTVAFTTAPSLSSSIVGPWASVSGTTWATLSGNTVVGLSSFADVDAQGSSIGNDSTTNVRVNAAGSGANTTLAAATTAINTLLQATPTAATIDTQSNTLRAGGIMIAAGQGDLTIGASAGVGTLTAATSGGDLVLWNHSGSTLTVNSVIANNSSASTLTKSGTGLLVLAGANTFTGNTTVNEGTLRLSNNAALGAPASSNRTTIRQAGVLDLALANMSGTAGILDGSGRITSSAASGTATLSIGAGNGTTGYFTGVIENGSAGGRLGLTKVGTGTQFITGLNTYTGPTQIEGGTLTVTTLANIGSHSGIGVGDATDDDTNAASLVFNGGVLQYTGANATVFQATQTPSVSIDRLFTLAGNGGIDSSGNFGSNSLSASQNNATLILANTGSVRYSGAAGLRTLTLTGNSTGDNRIAMLLADNLATSNTLALTKAGAGQWVLGNTANSYSGTTTVSGGMLVVGADADGVRTLPTASNLTLSGGVLQSTGTFARAVGTGGNQVRLTAANSGFAAGNGDLLVNLGNGESLTWGQNGFMTSGTVLYLNSPTSLGVVTFANPLNLGGGNRQIFVQENVNATTDYAVMSGVISGTGVLEKTGLQEPPRPPAPALRLSGQNTFSGTLQISSGPVVVESLGGSAVAASNAGGPQAVVQLDAVYGSMVGALNYIGPGETSDRLVRLGATLSAVSRRIDANGSGPLVLSNVVNDTAGSKTLILGGNYAGPNEISSNLGNGASGALTIQMDSGAMWILSGSNSFTGGIRWAAGGSLGIGSNHALGPATNDILQNLNQNSMPLFFAVGGARTIPNNWTLNFNQLHTFSGTNSITLTGTMSGGNSDGQPCVLASDIGGDGVLTITGPVSTTSGNFNIGGVGRTVFSGTLGGTARSVRYLGAGTLTMEGSHAASGWSTTNSSTTTAGTIIFSSSASIPGTTRNISTLAGTTLATGYAMDQPFLLRISSTTASFALGLAADSANSLNLSGTATGGVNFTAASLGAVGPATRVYSGTLTPNGTAYRLGGGGGTLDFQSALTGVSNTLTVGGDVTGLGGTVILSSATNSYGGATTVQRGILQVASLTDAGSNSSTGTNGTINLSSGTSTGTLRYVGSGNTSNRTINIAGTVGGTLDASGSGALDMTSGTISAAANTTLTLTGTSTAGNTMGPINGTGASVAKTGPGLWRLSGASSYSGRLTVSDGTVVVGTAVAGGNSPFGTATNDDSLPIIGSAATGLTGTAALLADNVEIARGFSVAALGAGSSQVAVIGNAGSGTATFAGGASIRLGRDVTLQAATGGEVVFAGTWRDTAGGTAPAVALTVGSAGNAGTVVFASDLPETITAVNIVRGTARIQGLDDRISFTTPVTIGSAGGPATLDLGGRSQSLGSVAFTGTGSQVATGTLRMFNGGSAAAVNVNGTGHAISSLVALDAATSFNVDAASRLLVGSAIGTGTSGGQTLTKTGLGILELAGQNTYSGDTTVSAGTLVVNGSLGAGALSVASGATLMGSGTIGGIATIFGTHSPGNSPGIETFASNLSYAGGSSQLVWELWGNTVSNSPLAYDQIIVNADLAFAGATSLSLDFGGSGFGAVDWDDAFWDAPQTWTLFDVAGSTTGFGNLSLTQNPSNWLDSSGQAFSASSRSANSFSVAQQGSDVVVSYTVIVPEPAGLALAGLGLAAVACALRRRK